MKDKITIQDAFEKNERIMIEFLWEVKCCRCGNIFYRKDDEFSFIGDKKLFDAAIEEYGALDYDDEIALIENADEQDIPVYRFCKEDDEDETSKCYICKDMLDWLNCREYVEIPQKLFDKLIDFFWDRCTDDSIPIIADIKKDIVKEFPEKFE